jgi:hypothetical protein
MSRIGDKKIIRIGSSEAAWIKGQGIQLLLARRIEDSGNFTNHVQSPVKVSKSVEEG